MMVLWISHKPWERGRLDQSMSILDRIVKTKKAARVGIDISSTTVKLLELSESNGGYRVESYSVSSLPHGAV